MDTDKEFFDMKEYIHIAAQNADKFTTDFINKIIADETRKEINKER